MPLRTYAVGAIAPAITESDKKEKPSSTQAVQSHSSFASKLKEITGAGKRPILLSIRASDQFIFATAAIGLFTSTFVHSILFPLSPFIISRINHSSSNENIPSTTEATASPFGGKSSVETSRETGILVALYAVGLLVGSPLFGWLGDKIRQRRIPMLLGISASIAANIMFMFAFVYWMLLLARFLQGVANACVWTMSLCLIADNWPESRLGLQMGKLMGFYPLGLVTGLPVGVLYARLGHQAPFIASMVLCGLDFFMRLVIVERCHSPKEWFIKQDAEVQDGNNTTQQHPSPEISTTHTNISSSCSHCGDNSDEDGYTKTNAPQVTVGKLLRQPRLLVSLHITLVVAAVMSSFESTLSMRLATEWHFDEAAIGLILLSYMVPSIAASAVAGWFCDKYGPKIVALVSIVLVTPVCIAIGLPDKNTPFWPLVLILIIGGTTMAGCQAPVFPEIARVVANENKSTSKRDGLARSYGLFNAAYGAGMCFGPILAGFLYSSIGFFWLCFVLSMMFVVCFPFAYIYTGGNRRQLINRNHNKDQIQVITVPSPASQTSIPTLFTNSNIHNEHI